MICRRCGAVSTRLLSRGLCAHCRLDDAATRARAHFYRGTTMKAPFENLTDSEILALGKEAEIADYIDRSCAEQGIALLPPRPPVEPDLPPEPEKDVTVWRVKRGFSVLVECINEADATALASFLMGIKTVDPAYLPGANYTDRKVNLHPDPPTYAVEPVHYYSDTQAAHFAEVLEQRFTKKKQHEEAKDAYDKAVRERSKATAWIREKVNEVHARERERARLLATWTRYLELAAGDVSIAARFMIKGNPTVRELFPNGIGNCHAWPDETEVIAAKPETEDVQW